MKSRNVLSCSVVLVLGFAVAACSSSPDDLNDAFKKDFGSLPGAPVVSAQPSPIPSPVVSPSPLPLNAVVNPYAGDGVTCSDAFLSQYQALFQVSVDATNHYETGDEASGEITSALQNARKQVVAFRQQYKTVDCQTPSANGTQDLNVDSQLAAVISSLDNCLNGG